MTANYFYIIYFYFILYTEDDWRILNIFIIIYDIRKKYPARGWMLFVFLCCIMKLYLLYHEIISIFIIYQINVLL